MKTVLQTNRTFLTRPVALSKITLVFLAILTIFRVSSNLRESLVFTDVMHSLLVAEVSNSSLSLCDRQDLVPSLQLIDEQRVTLGGALVSFGCLQVAAQILPDQTNITRRADMLAYQQGLIAWLQQDLPGAAALWRQGYNIDRHLLTRARNAKEKDILEAQRWYEAAIMSASSPQMLAESIAAYSEELRGRISSEVVRERLDYLASYFGLESAAGYRLRGERALRGGGYQEAFNLLSQAILLGMSDSETWYLLGNAAWKLNDLPTTEQAYRAALRTPIQIPWRRPWHLNSLAALLSSQERLAEALLYQEEAVYLSNYYVYTDNLAMLYAELGQTTKAQMLCAQARSLSASPQIRLQCEEQ